MVLNAKYQVRHHADGISVCEGSNPITPLQFMTEPNASKIANALNNHDAMLYLLKRLRDKLCLSLDPYQRRYLLSELDEAIKDAEAEC